MGLSIAIVLIVLVGIAIGLALYNHDAMVRMHDEQRAHNALMNDIRAHDKRHGDEDG